MPLYQYRFDEKTITRQKRGLQLAYRQLALELAKQRRKDGVEGPIPNDILGSYPPEPDRLFGDARWSAYLFYAAGRKKQAEEMLQQALEIQEQNQFSIQLNWPDWVFGRARVLAQLRKDPQKGEKFIRWISRLPIFCETISDRKIIAKFYAEEAFQVYASGQKKSIRLYAWRAVSHDYQWLFNRGLWAISWKAGGKNKA